MTKKMVAKMLDKKEFNVVKTKHPDFDAGKVITENTGEFKGGLENMKTDLKAKLPKPKKLAKPDLGNKYR